MAIIRAPFGSIDLAHKKRPEGAAAPSRPETGFLRGRGEYGVAVAAPHPALKLSSERRRTVNQLSAKVRRLVTKGKAGQARDVLSRQDLRDGLSAAEYDSMRAMVARGYFAAGDDQEALRLAERAVGRSGVNVPEGLWTAGLAAWRLGEFERAAGHFSTLARSGSVDRDLVAGGAYWAARAYGMLREPLLINEMLRIAAAHPRSIYGLTVAAFAVRQAGPRLGAGTPVDQGVGDFDRRASGAAGHRLGPGRPARGRRG